MRLRLPQRDFIEKSHDDDPLDFYYYPITGYVYRRRLAMALSLLGPGPFGRLLEIGFGSGILLPELARRAREVHGVDIHGKIDAVERMLRAHGATAALCTGDIFALPYPDDHFDAVICLSVLEHLTELDRACAQIRRVLAPGGAGVLGFPVRNLITTAFFRAVGYDEREIHPSTHRDILAAGQRAFAVERVLRFPAPLPVDLALYVVCRCLKR
jgi:ubiquinone/menaquinone biosynthesis C-methylase UbiE